MRTCIQNVTRLHPAGNSPISTLFAHSMANSGLVTMLGSQEDFWQIAKEDDLGDIEYIICSGRADGLLV